MVSLGPFAFYSRGKCAVNSYSELNHKWEKSWFTSNTCTPWIKPKMSIYCKRNVVFAVYRKQFPGFARKGVVWRMESGPQQGKWWTRPILIIRLLIGRKLSTNLKQWAHRSTLYPGSFYSPVKRAWVRNCTLASFKIICGIFYFYRNSNILEL